MKFNLVNLIKKINPNGQSVEIEGNCKITNYKNSSALIKNPLTIVQKDGQLSVDGLAQQEYKDIESSLSVFSRIASMDGNVNNLTAEDLKLARQDYSLNKSIWEKLGVSSFRYDPSEDIANLTICDQTLRIDFDNPKTKKQNAEEKSKPVEQKQESKAAEKAHVPVADTKKASQTGSLQKTKSTAKTAKVPDKYAGIKKEWIPYIQATAKKYGYSEELIITIALSEGFTEKPEHKNEGGKGGLWEAGFGHTTRANHNTDFPKDKPVKLKDAFDWLGRDIKDKEAEIKKFGNYYNYNKLPQPLKEMMIDVAFNRGEARLNPKLKLSKEEKEAGKIQKYDDHYDSAIANIEIESWGAAAVRFRQEEFSASIKKQGKEGGLRKRNVQRFLRVMDYLSPEKIVGAMDLFNREYYYTKTLGMLKQSEADTLRAQWNSVYYKAKAKCAKQ